MRYEEAPNYLQAADMHNIGDSGTSIFEDVATTLGNTPSFLAVSIASGLNSFYNTGVAVGNIFSDADNQTAERDTAEWISDYDDDLGKYYEANKSAADIVGFIGTSLVPGLGGVKALRAGQGMLRAAAVGEVGTNMRLATNLLAPTMETYVKREAADLAAKSATFSFANGNALRALAAGTQQGVLESLAFETAVTATMFKSPILEDMDTEDLIKNIAMGTLVGGAFSAVGSAAGTYFGVKKLVQAADLRQNPSVFSTQLTSSAEATIHSDRIVVGAADRELLETPVTYEEVLAKKMAAGETGESLATDAVRSEVTKINRLRQDNLQKIANEQRTGIRTMAGEDTLGNDVADLMQSLSAKDTQATFLNMKNISRLAEKTSVQTRVKELISGGLAKNKKQALKLIDDEGDVNIQLHSGNIGETISGSPGIAKLADKYTPDQINKLALKVRAKVTDRTDFRKIKSAEEAELHWYAVRNSSDAFYHKSVIGAHDLPYLEKAVNDGVDSIIIGSSNKLEDQRVIKGLDEIKKYYRQAQEEVALAQKQAKHSSNMIELTSNIRRDYLEGVSKYDDLDTNFSAQQSYAKELSDKLGKEVTAAALHLKPRIAKVTYDMRKISDEEGHLLEGMRLIKYREKLAKAGVEKVFTKFSGEAATLFPEIPEALLRQANRTETGAGFATNAGASYGKLDQMTSYIGNLVSELTKTRINNVRETFNPVGVRLLENPESAIRFSAINEIIAGTPEQYVLSESKHALIPRKLRDYERALLEGAEPPPYTLAPGTREEILLDTPELRDAVEMHIALNGTRNQSWKELHAAQGNTDDKALDVFRPVRPNPRDYRHIAFIKDETLVGVGHTRMLFANTSKELEDQIKLVPSQYKVYTKGQAEEFYNARGEYIYDKTLNENYIDHDLLSRGISSRFFPQTDPQKIVNSLLDHHVQGENALTKAMVLGRYEKEVAELRRLGDQFTNLSSSKTGRDPIVDQITSSDKNPYLSQIKAMLNITKTDEIPWMVTTNQAIDRFASKAWQKATDLFQSGGGKFTQEKADQINGIFDELGIKTAYYDAATDIMANSTVPKGALSAFVRKANAFLTTTILRLDPFNALNNLLGNSVLMSTELKSLTDAIKKGSSEGAGELAALSKIAVPGVEGATAFSPSKLIANSIARLHGEGKDALIAEYKARGLVPDLNDQYYKSLDAMSLTGTESVKDISTKSAKLSELATEFANHGEKFTGNKFVEQFNRLLAADVMKQITEIGVKHGVLDEKAAWAYVNTFVNRTQGVIRAAERPLMFQGPIGQAIGLFQSYQFNLMQQMFRHVGEGNRKAGAMLLGMQGSIYGASSLPGFNLINTTLVGNAYGNPEHKDFYSATNAIFGKQGADWLMFGAPSNILRASLFTRGDTNPRTWSIVPNPTNPGDIPFISAFAKVFGSTSQILKDSANGAPVWDSLLNGIEHMGLNRPLAGMAQTARAFTNEDGQVTSTQANGTILGSNDLVSWSTLVRLAGAKPIDEAITSNAYFRIQSYMAADRSKRESLGTAVKLGLQGGGTFTGEEIGEFAQQYLEKGGKQTGFNSWMMTQYKNTDRSLAEALARQLNSSYARSMQEAMGGRDSLGGESVDGFTNGTW